MSSMNKSIKMVLRKNKMIFQLFKKFQGLINLLKKYTIARQEYIKFKYIINNIKKENKRTFYFCAAIHNNLGDLAQRLCIERIIKEKCPNTDIILVPTIMFEWYTNRIIKSIEKVIDITDTIVFQSGYTMSDFHPDDKVRKVVLHKFMNNKMIIFPQTILYKDQIKERNAVINLHKNKNLKLLVRDPISYRTAKNRFADIDSELYPDVVTTLIGKFNFSDQKRQGIGMCLRNDSEKYYNDREINQLIDKLSKYGNIEVTDTNCIIERELNEEYLEKIVIDKIKMFSKYKLIITDRYHGTIFSLIAGTPVIVIKTNDHKVSSGVDWFKGIYDDYAFYSDSLDHIPTIVNNIMKNKDLEFKLHSYFKEKYYDDLELV